MPGAADTLIIGDGIVARTVAWELASSGMSMTRLRSTLLEREMATRAAGAMLGAFGEITVDDVGPRADTELEFRYESQQLFPQLLDMLEEMGGTRPHTTQGTVVVGNNEGKDDFKNLKCMEAAARTRGVKAEWIEPEDVEGLKPSREYRPHSCLFLPTEDGVDSGTLLESLAAALRSVDRETVVEGVAASVDRRGANWVVTTESGNKYETARVIVCVGAWAQRLLGDERWRHLGLPHLFFGKGASCIVKRGPSCPHVLRTPNRAFACGAHLVPRAHDLLYLGATNYFGHELGDEAEIEPGELHILFDQVIHQINVDVRRAKIVSIQFGYRPITAAREPIVGETNEPGLFIVTGTYRNGVVMAPLIAKHVVEEVRKGSPAAENPYSPKGRPRPASTEIDESVIANGVRDLSEILREPGGHLPYDRTEEINRLIGSLWSLAFVESKENAALKRHVRESLEKAPLTETVNRLFYDLIAVK
jgi:glycine/D-amino acid oxidase-like deaminating enzyme